MVLRDNRLRVLRVFLIFAVLGILLATAEWCERKLGENDEYEVYSAYLSESILSNAHDWSAGWPIQVVIHDPTEAGSNLRFWFSRLVDERMSFPELQFSTRASYVVHNLLSRRVRAKFVLPGRATAALTSESDYGSPEFEKEFPGNAGLVVLSGVGFNLKRDQAVFYISHFCGLCGGGRYVTMRKVKGSWHVVAERYTWIS